MKVVNHGEEIRDEEISEDLDPQDPHFYRVILSGHFRFVVVVSAPTSDLAIEYARESFEEADPEEFLGNCVFEITDEYAGMLPGID